MHGEEYETARIILESITVSENEMVGVQMLLLNVYYNLNKFEQVIELGDKLLEKHPEDTGFLLKHGIALIQTGDIERGLRDILLLMKIDPLNTSAPFIIAKMMFDTGDYHLAISLLEQNIKDTHLTIHQKLLAEIYAEACYFEDALDMMELYLQGESGDRDAQLKYIRLLEVTGKYDAALELVNQYILDNTEDSMAYSAKAGILIGSGDLDEIDDIIKKSLELDNKNHEAFLYKGALEFLKGKNNDALSCIEMSVKLHVIHRRALEYKILIYQEMGDTENFEITLAEYHIFAQNKPPLMVAYRMIKAEYLVEKGDIPEAITQLAEIIQYNPDHIEARVCRAELLFNTGDHDDATSDINHAINLSPNEPYFYQLRGMIYYHSGRFTDAIEDFKKIEALGIDLKALADSMEDQE